MLTAELTEREIKNKLWEVYTELKREHDFHLGALIIKLSKRLRSQAGRCLSNTRQDIYTITLSLPLLEECGWERFEKTFRHEMAHAYCEKTYGRCGHNHTFKRTCVKFGGSMNPQMAGWRYKEAATTEYHKRLYKWKYTCPCGVSMEYGKRMSTKMRNSLRHTCKKCRTAVAHWQEEEL